MSCPSSFYLNINNHAHTHANTHALLNNDFMAGNPRNIRMDRNNDA